MYQHCLQEAKRFMSNCKRQQLLSIDTAHALHMLGEPVSALYDRLLFCLPNGEPVQAVLAVGGPAAQFSSLATDGQSSIVSMDQGVTHTTQAAKRGRETSEPVPDALYRHWFVLGGTLVASRFAPSDADVLGADVVEKRFRAAAGVPVPPPSQHSAEYIAARSAAEHQAADGIVASLSPQQLAFLQGVGSALATAAGGAAAAPWLPSWAAQAVAAPAAASAWGALPAHGSVSSDAWMPRCRAAVSALGGLTSSADVAMPLGVAADMLHKSVSHARDNVPVLRCVIALITALTRRQQVPLDQHLHRLLPAVLSTLLVSPPLHSTQLAEEAFAVKDAAARLVALILLRYGDVYASLRPRLEAVLRHPLRALSKTNTAASGSAARLDGQTTESEQQTGQGEEAPTVLALYGAVQAMVALGDACVAAEVQPVLKQLQSMATAPQSSDGTATDNAIATYSAAMLDFALRCAQAANDGRRWIERPEAPAAPAQAAAASAANAHMPSAAGMMSLYGGHASAAATSTAVQSTQMMASAPAMNGDVAAAPAASASPLLNGTASAAQAQHAEAAAANNATDPAMQTSSSQSAPAVSSAHASVSASAPTSAAATPASNAPLAAAAAPAPAPAPAPAAADDEEEDVEFDL